MEVWKCSSSSIPTVVHKVRDRICSSWPNITGWILDLAIDQLWKLHLNILWTTLKFWARHMCPWLAFVVDKLSVVVTRNVEWNRIHELLAIEVNFVGKLTKLLNSVGEYESLAVGNVVMRAHNHMAISKEICVAWVRKRRAKHLLANL